MFRAAERLSVSRSASGATPKDVTGFASWSTSDPSIATIDSVGWVTVYRDGNVAIRATYRDAEEFLPLQVQVGGLSRYYYALSGYVRDVRDSSIVADAAVAVVSGPNSGRSATTGADGAYQFYDLQVGTFTVRITKTGYVTTERTFTLTGDHLNTLDVTLTAAP